MQLRSTEPFNEQIRCSYFIFYLFVIVIEESIRKSYLYVLLSFFFFNLSNIHTRPINKINYITVIKCYVIEIRYLSLWKRNKM